MSEYLNEGAPVRAIAKRSGETAIGLWQKARGWVSGGCLVTALAVTLCSVPFVIVARWGWNAVADNAHDHQFNVAPMRTYVDPLNCNAQGLSVMAWWEDGRRRYQCIEPLK